jgi:site-specific DNA-adenine methylase
MSFPGGKAGSGVYQQIINQIPPHDVYVEPFLGDGAVMRHKKPAWETYLYDIDPAVVLRFPADAWPHCKCVAQNALVVLPQHLSNPFAFIYCDPPYPRSSRSCARPLYRFEMTDDQHSTLLDLVRSQKAMVAISSYANPLYDETLADWRRVEFQTVNRRGNRATEVLWMNYPEPTALHDYTYLGNTFRERERLSRKRKRWVARLERMPILERLMLSGAIAEYEARRRCAPPDQAEKGL